MQLLLHCVHTGTHLEGQDGVFFSDRRESNTNTKTKNTLWILWLSLITAFFNCFTYLDFYNLKIISQTVFTASSCDIEITG